MKKLVIFMLAVIILVAVPLNTVVVAADEPIRVMMDGIELTFDAQPRIVSDRTLVPLRGIFEAMGATVLWNGDTQTATALRLDSVVKLVIGSEVARVSKEERQLDVPAHIFESRTFVPLRFISESLGAEVSWDSNSRTVTITTDKAHWSDPGDNLSHRLLFTSEWVDMNTGDKMTFDSETFIEINDNWPDGSEDLFYSYSETSESERNIVSMFLGGAHLKDHWLEFDPDTRILTEYLVGDALANWSIAENTGTTPAAPGKPQNRSYTLADFEGWWHQISGINFGMGDLFYLDAQKGTYYGTDKYGNPNETLKASYDSQDDELFLEADRYSTADGIELFFGEDGSTDILYYISFHDDEVYPAFKRGEAPRIPETSLTGLPGKWYKNGITTGNDVEIIELSETATYHFLNYAGKVGKSGSYALKLKAGEFYRGDEYDYLSLELDGESAYISDDRRLIAVSYYYEDKYTAMGTPMYAGSHIYLHESEIGSKAASDAVQRFKLNDYSWSGADNGSLRFSRNGQVHYYGYNERGWFPEKAGRWEYSDGALTITWTGDFVDYELKNRSKAQEEKCNVEDVENGFTLPSLGRISREKDD